MKLNVFFPVLKPPTIVKNLASSLFYNSGGFKTGKKYAEIKTVFVELLSHYLVKGERRSEKKVKTGRGIHHLEINDTPVIPVELRQWFEQQTGVNFQMPFKTSLQSFARYFTRSMSQKK